MTQDSSAPNSSKNEEPLSATAMFLRSMDEPSAASEQDASWGAAGVPAATPGQGPSGAGPGEFTRMFQLPQQEISGAVPSKPAVQTTAHPSALANAGPGQFTQILYTGSGSHEAKTLAEPPPYVPQASPLPGPGSRKGFSTPGASDSASGEGNATQMFRPAPATAPQPASFQQSVPIQVGSAEPALPNPAYMSEPGRKAQEQNHLAPGLSVTQLISSLAEPQSPGGKRSADPVPYTPAQMPAFSSPPQPEHLSPPEAGSVTRLIQQLAQGPAAPAAQLFPPRAPVAPAVSGPGEFTRMISVAAAHKAEAPMTPPPQPMPQFPAMPQVAMPQAPQMPHLQAGAGAPSPQMQLPAMQMPKPPVMPPFPQLAAPKSKLEAMVPVLLIVNTFLLVLVLVVVLFALKAH